MADSPAPPPLDAQDPLPDPSWDFRRWFVAGFFVILAGLRAYTVHMNKGAGLLDWLMGMVIVCYLIAPSAEQMTKMLATASLLKSGVTMRQTTTQTDTPDKSTREAVTTVAPAPEKTDEHAAIADPTSASLAGGSGNPAVATLPDDIPAGLAPAGAPSGAT